MHRIISLIDLLSFEESKKIILRGDESEFYNLLNDIGFDIGEDISYQICTHRPMIDNTPVYTARWIGRERRDTAWMRSGWCSFDNRLEIVGLTDLWMQKELVNMSQTPNFTRMAIDHLKNNSGNPDVFDIKKGETL